jgi:hypothetical protein
MHAAKGEAVAKKAAHEAAAEATLQAMTKGHVKAE